MELREMRRDVWMERAGRAVFLVLAAGCLWVIGVVALEAWGLSGVLDWPSLQASDIVSLVVALVALLVSFAAWQHDRQQSSMVGLDIEVINVYVPRVQPPEPGTTVKTAPIERNVIVAIHPVGPGTRFGVSIAVWGPDKGAVKVESISADRESWRAGDGPMRVVLSVDSSIPLSRWEGDTIKVGLAWAAPGGIFRSSLRDHAVRQRVPPPWEKNAVISEYEELSRRTFRWVPKRYSRGHDVIGAVVNENLRRKGDGFASQDRDTLFDEVIQEHPELASFRALMR